MTTSQSPPSRWARFIPRQFSLRVLLVVIAVFSLGLWCLIQPRGEGVTERQARRVQLGMASAEVLAILGKPKAEVQGKSDFLFVYQIKTSFLSDNLFFVIDGKNGRVSSIQRLTGSELVRIRDEMKAALSARAN